MDSGKTILIPTKRTVTMGGTKAGSVVNFDLYVEDVRFCPLCGLEGPHGRNMGIREEMSKINFHPTAYYSICGRCGLIFQNPTMDDKSLELFYPNIYRQNLTGTSSPTTGEFSREVVRSTLLLAFMDKCGILPERMLDIGTSLGMFPILARKKYYCRITGVEMNREFVGLLIRRGIPCYTDISLVPGKFDLITAIHLLEHCPRPLEMLAEIRKRLQIGGHLLIEVPLSWGGGHAGVLKFWHPTIFSPKTLRIALESAGFRIVRAKINGGWLFRYPVMETVIATLDENAVEAGWTEDKEAFAFLKFLFWNGFYQLWKKVSKYPIGSKLTRKNTDKSWKKMKEQVPVDWEAVREHPNDAELWGDQVLFGTRDEEETAVGEG